MTQEMESRMALKDLVDRYVAEWMEILKVCDMEKEVMLLTGADKSVWR